MVQRSQPSRPSMIIVAAMLAAGCGIAAPGSNAPPSVTPTVGPSSALASASPTANAVTPQLDPAHAVTQLVPVSGATLEATDAAGDHFALAIPPNALVEPTQITLTPLIGVEGLPATAQFITGVDLAPDGLRLIDLATLDITPANRDGGTALAAMSYSANGTASHRVPRFSAATASRLYLAHFSGEFLTSGAVPVLGEVPGRSFDVALDEELAQQQTPQDERGPWEREDVRDQVAAILEQALTEAEQAGIDCSTKDTIAFVIETELMLERQRQLLGIEVDDTPAEVALGDHLERVRAQLEGVLGSCACQGDVDAIRDLISIERQRQLTGGDEPNYEYDTSTECNLGDAFGTITWDYTSEYTDTNGTTSRRDLVTANVRLAAHSDGFDDAGSSFTWTGEEHLSEPGPPCSTQRDDTWSNSQAFADNEDASISFSIDDTEADLPWTASLEMWVQADMHGHAHDESFDNNSGRCTVNDYDYEQGGAEWVQNPWCEPGEVLHSKPSADGRTFDFSCTFHDSQPMNENGTSTETVTVSGTITIATSPPS